MDLNKPVFTGRRALLAEKQQSGGRWRLVKLDIDGNKPAHNAYVYAGNKQAGFVTSAMWSPVAKKNIAIANVEVAALDNGKNLSVEIYYQRELHWSKQMAAAQVLDAPFWDPPRRRQTPPDNY